MNRLYTYFIALSCLLVSFGTIAQQSTRLSQYMFNPILMNPAATGNVGNINISGGFKSMWANVPGAPTTQFVSVDGTVKRKKFGVGLEIQNDQAGLLSQRKAVVNGSYRKRLTGKSWLAVGVGLGAKQHLIDGAKSTFQTEGDAAISTVFMNKWSPATTAGIYFFNGNSAVGLSAENVLKYTVNFTGQNRDIISSSVTRFQFTAGHRFRFSKDLSLKQFVAVKYEYNNPIQVDITPMLEYQEKIALGVGYRYNESISMIIQNQINDQFRVGYSYDFQTNRLASVTNGSHELMLTYTIVKNKPNFSNPRYF